MVDESNLYENFYNPSEEFKREPRYFFYDMAIDLINKAKKSSKDWYTDENTIKGILLLLFTWNFAARKTKELNFDNVKKVLLECENNLRHLEVYSIENINKNAENKIKNVFGKFKELMGQTGASKALSLLNPKLFVMWDTKIREYLRQEKIIKGIGNGEKPEYYVKFLLEIKNIIERYNIKDKLSKSDIVAKKIDEYNYVRIVQKNKENKENKKCLNS